MLFTRRKNWTEPERRVMRAAGRHHGLRFAGVAVVILLAAFLGFDFWRQARQRQANTAADAVITAAPDAVPLAIENLRPLGSLSAEELRGLLADNDRSMRLHAAYALSALGEPPQQLLLDEIPHASEAECRNLVAALAPIKDSVLRELRARAGIESAGANDAVAEGAGGRSEAKPPAGVDVPTGQSLDTAAGDSVGSTPATRARYAIVALQLGDPQPSQEILALRPDPIHRTTYIHAFPDWHGDLSVVADLLASAPHPRPLSRGVPGRGEPVVRGVRGEGSQKRAGSEAFDTRHSSLDRTNVSHPRPA